MTAIEKIINSSDPIEYINVKIINDIKVKYLKALMYHCEEYRTQKYVDLYLEWSEKYNHGGWAWHLYDILIDKRPYVEAFKSQATLNKFVEWEKSDDAYNFVHILFENPKFQTKANFITYLNWETNYHQFCTYFKYCELYHSQEYITLAQKRFPKTNIIKELLRKK